MDTRDSRAVGAWLGLAADALFLVALGLICLFGRLESAGWPDTPEFTWVEPTLPFTAAGTVLLAAWSWRALPRIVAFLLIAAALAVMALFWNRADARGLTIGLGHYSIAVFTISVVWTLHVFGTLVYAGTVIRKTSGAFLALYLAFLGLVGGLCFAVVLL